MNPNQTTTSPATKVAMFDHEKLDVYHLELQFVAWVTPLLKEVSRAASGTTREVRDQLDRASLSLLLNTAEGNGKRQRPVRAKFFDDARGSATECAACLDALVAKGVTIPERIMGGKQLLVRIVSMLCGLIARFDGGALVRDEANGSEINQNPEPVSYLNSRTRTRTTARRKN